MARTMTWIVVADGSRGRILVQERLGSPLRRAFDEEDLVARPRTRADIPTGEDGPDPPAGPALAPFIADIVNAAARERRFERLIVVAPPQLLGDLRRALTPHARALVSTE